MIRLTNREQHCVNGAATVQRGSNRAKPELPHVNMSTLIISLPTSLIYKSAVQISYLNLHLCLSNTHLNALMPNERTYVPYQTFSSIYL